MAGGRAAKPGANGEGANGEASLIFTPSGSFKVEGTIHDTVRRLAAEEWPMFTLSDGGDGLVVRSSEVVAVQHVPGSRGRLGFRP